MIDVALDPRLKKFFDSKKKAWKRAQCLMKFIVVAPTREADLFQGHSHAIYVVLERSISFYENLPLKRKEATLSSTLSSVFHAEQVYKIIGAYSIYY